MIKHYLNIFIFLLPIYALAQFKNCEPTSPVNLNRLAIKEQVLVDKINANKQAIEYKEEEIKTLKDSIRKCNLATSQRLREIEGNIARAALKYQEILSIKDISSIRQQIEDLKKSKEESKKILEKNLQQVRIPGLFIVLLSGIDNSADKKFHITTAQESITDIAIQDLNGEAMERLTTVTDYVNVKDIIRSYKGGQLDHTTADLYNMPDYKNKQFVYAAKVFVSPISIDEIKSKKSFSPPTPTTAMPKALVLNPFLQPDFINILKKEGISMKNLADLEENIRMETDNIANEAEEAERFRNDILLRGEIEIQKINKQINEFTLLLGERVSKLEMLIGTIPNATFNKSDIAGSVKLALDGIKKQISQLDNEWNSTKEREIQYKETNVNVEATPAQSIAAEAIKLYLQLQKNYTFVRKNMEYIEVEDFAVKNYQSANEVKVIREVQQIWAYCSPQENGTFRLTLLSRFKITGFQKKNHLAPTLIFLKGDSTYEYGDIFTPNSLEKKTVAINDFYISNTEVSFREYDIYCKEQGGTLVRDNSWGRDSMPIMNVSWLDAINYCNWLSEKEALPPYYTVNGTQVSYNEGSKGFRLPTEAEWEYAARAEGQKFRFGNTTNTIKVTSANYDKTLVNRTMPVKSYAPNSKGVYNTSGNVAEWCWDIFTNSINQKPATTEVRRVVKGGAWNSGWQDIQVFARDSHTVQYTSNDLGFRIARSK